jgi:GxxExxY protein
MGHEFDELSSRVIDSAITVHKSLGPGFIESVYEEALSVELTHRAIVHTRQQEVPMFYREQLVGTHRLDVFVEKSVIVELKAIKELEDIHFAILRSYLKATKVKIGLLMNFNSPTLTIKRVVN